MHLVYLSAPWIVDVFVVAWGCRPLMLLRAGPRRRSESCSNRVGSEIFFFFCASGKLSTQAACEAQLLAP